MLLQFVERTPASALATAKRRARGRADGGDDSGSDDDDRGGSAAGVDSDDDAEALMASAAISDKLKDALEGMTEKRCGPCAAAAGPALRCAHTHTEWQPAFAHPPRQGIDPRGVAGLAESTAHRAERSRRAGRLVCGGA